MLPGKAGGIASLAGSFKSLGLSPSMAAKFVPIMTKFVNVKGGTEVADLVSGVWK
jgi:predicted anti-sigma-YlaC factor YlaD